MNNLIFESVSKRFQHRPSLLNLIGKERRGITVALANISIQAEPGQVLVLLGPNGSGKTTLLKLIATMLLPDSGRVLVAGMDTKISADKIRKKIGFTIAAEKSFYPRLTARENLRFFAVLENVHPALREQRIMRLLETTGISAAADTLVMKFSTGMYQKLGLARALLKQPTFLLLDEPTRSLAPEAVADFWALVRALADQGTTIVMASHNFEEASAIGDSIAVILNGTLALHRTVKQLSGEDLRALYFAVLRSIGSTTNEPLDG